MVCQDCLDITFSGKQLIPRHHWTGIAGNRLARAAGILYLSPTQIAPHGFDVCPLTVRSTPTVGAVREAISIVIRRPRADRESGVEVFSTIKIANRCSDGPQLKVDHAPLYIDLGIVRVRLEVAGETR